MATQDEQKGRASRQMMQIFGIAEKPVMEFVSGFLDEPPSVIFSDEVPSTSDPLILKPFDDQEDQSSSGDYYQFNIEVVDLKTDDPNRVEVINSLINHERIKEGIGFLYYCVKNAYASLLAASMINNNPIINLKIEMDEDNWCMYFKFYHELTHKRCFYQELLRTAMNNRENYNTMNEEQKSNVNRCFMEAVEQLKEIDKQITPSIKQLENDTNAKNKDKCVLGIFLKKINEADLPRPEKLPVEELQLPAISDVSYE